MVTGSIRRYDVRSQFDDDRGSVSFITHTRISTRRRIRCIVTYSLLQIKFGWGWCCAPDLFEISILYPTVRINNYILLLQLNSCTRVRARKPNGVGYEQDRILRCCGRRPVSVQDLEFVIDGPKRTENVLHVHAASVPGVGPRAKVGDGRRSRSVYQIW